MPTHPSLHAPAAQATELLRTTCDSQRRARLAESNTTKRRSRGKRQNGENQQRRSSCRSPSPGHSADDKMNEVLHSRACMTSDVRVVQNCRRSTTSLILTAAPVRTRLNAEKPGCIAVTALRRSMSSADNRGASATVAVQVPEGDEGQVFRPTPASAFKSRTSPVVRSFAKGSLRAIRWAISTVNVANSVSLASAPVPPLLSARDS